MLWTSRLLVRRPVGLHLIRYCSSTTTANPFQVCIIGSGPSGFYACGSLLEKNPNTHVTIFERLPVPFGLIRYGVAPDHPEVKLVQNKFEEMVSNNIKKCYFVGNINVGEDVSVADLQKMYHAVILAYGSAAERKLGIPGEELPGVYSARSFVAWLNGHPDFQREQFDLTKSTQAVVIGQGNVALDVARILLRSTQELQSTDITDQALKQLSQSTIQEVHVIGRRGPQHAAFTTKELREILTLPNVECFIADASTLPNSEELAALDRPKRRLMDLIMKLKPKTETTEPSTKKKLIFHFFRKPTTFFQTQDKEGKECVGVKINDTRSDNKNCEDMIAGAVFRSIGYKSLKLPGVPFDDVGGVVPNQIGRVTATSSASEVPIPGLYVSGWLKRGPSGIIATNKWDAEETVQCVLEDMKEIQKQKKEAAAGFEGLHEILSKKGLNPVSYHEWKMIDQEERRRGKQSGKSIEKITIISDMMELIRQKP